MAFKRYGPGCCGCVPTKVSVGVILSVIQPCPPRADNGQPNQSVPFVITSVIDPTGTERLPNHRYTGIISGPEGDWVVTVSGSTNPSYHFATPVTTTLHVTRVHSNGIEYFSVAGPQLLSVDLSMLVTMPGNTYGAEVTVSGGISYSGHYNIPRNDTGSNFSPDAFGVPLTDPGIRGVVYEGSPNPLNITNPFGRHDFTITAANIKGRPDGSSDAANYPPYTLSRSFTWSYCNANIGDNYTFGGILLNPYIGPDYYNPNPPSSTPQPMTMAMFDQTDNPTASSKRASWSNVS